MPWSTQSRRPSHYILGLDPLEIGYPDHRLGVFCIGYETAVPAVVRAGIEMAFLDAAGKALKRPVYSLLGGAVRDRVETAAYLFFRYKGENGWGVSLRRKPWWRALRN